MRPLSCYGACRALRWMNTLLNQDAPPSIFGADSLGQLPGRWSVAVTKPTAEFTLCRKLASGLVPGVAYYLPQQHTAYQCRAYRIKPLFPYYVFLKGTMEQIADVRTMSRCILDTLRVVQQERMTRELLALEQTLSAANYVLTTFAEGTQIRVTTGPFMGMEGRILRNDGRKLVALFNVLGGATMEDISPDVLELAA